MDLGNNFNSNKNELFKGKVLVVPLHTLKTIFKKIQGKGKGK